MTAALESSPHEIRWTWVCPCLHTSGCKPSCSLILFISFSVSQLFAVARLHAQSIIIYLCLAFAILSVNQSLWLVPTFSSELVVDPTNLQVTLKHLEAAVQLHKVRSVLLNIVLPIFSFSRICCLLRILLHSSIIAQAALLVVMSRLWYFT